MKTAMTIQKMKKYLHVLLGVIRISKMVMEILAVISEDGVIWNVIQSILIAILALYGVRVS